MKTAKSLDAAIEKGAFMVFADDWRSMKELDPDAIGRALYLAVNDSWNDGAEHNIGNGFLCIPRNRIKEISDTENGPTAIIYSALIKSNVAARKTYIKGNRRLADAIEKLNADKSDDKVATPNE